MLTKIEMEAMEAVKGIRDELRKQREINWEQRRYEIAKEVYPIVCHDMAPSADKKEPALVAVELADMLIDELVAKKRLG